MSLTNKTVAIIGAGPAGLMAAEVLADAGVSVSVYDAMPSVGRKFLMAGKGGLNITHSEPFVQFLTRYGDNSPHLASMIEAFPPNAIQHWIHSLGITTFVGSSGRVFPQEMKAAPLLRSWLHRLRGNGVRFHMRHHWLGWTSDKKLLFNSNNTEHHIAADAVLLALGGGSWPQLGSTASWVSVLEQQHITITPLKPANCGFDLTWTAYFKQRFAGQAVKTTALGILINNETVWHAGELLITDYGVEGSLIYAKSAYLRDEIARQGYVDIYLDLKPDLDLDCVLSRLLLPRGKNSLANHLRKRLGLDAVKIALLREAMPIAKLDDFAYIARTLKALPLSLHATRPLAEAISTAGGVAFSGVDSRLMLKDLPSVFCAGEMLDWEAPTGGYLLTACLATGRHAGLGILNWLNNH